MKTDHANKNWIKDLKLTSLGWELALPIVGGTVLGFKLDQLIGKQYFFTIILLFLGVIIGYYSLFRQIELEILRSKAEKLRNQKEKHSA